MFLTRVFLSNLEGFLHVFGGLWPVFNLYESLVFPVRLEKVFNFSKEDFMPKNSPQPGVY